MLFYFVFVVFSFSSFCFYFFFCLFVSSSWQPLRRDEFFWYKNTSLSTSVEESLINLTNRWICFSVKRNEPRLNPQNCDEMHHILCEDNNGGKILIPWIVFGWKKNYQVKGKILHYQEMLKRYRKSRMKLRHIDPMLSLQSAVTFSFFSVYHETTRRELSSVLKINFLLFTKTTWDLLFIEVPCDP